MVLDAARLEAPNTKYGDRNKLHNATELHAASQVFAEMGWLINQDSDFVPESGCLACVLNSVC